MPHERDDAMDSGLWEVLGRAPMKEASPYFVRRVLRQVREKESYRPAWLGWLGRLALPAAAAAVAVGICLAAEVSDRDGSPFADKAAIEFEAIINLDTLLAEQEVALWSADS